MQVSQEKEFHLPGEHTNMIVWQLQSKNHKVILCKLLSPPIPAFPCCCVSLPSGALLNQWTALLEVSISLQFSAVFSCAEVSQTVPASAQLHSCPQELFCSPSSSLPWLHVQATSLFLPALKIPGACWEQI